MGKKEKVLCLWILVALLILITTISLFETALPLFTFIWLIVSLIVVLNKKDAKVLGIKKVNIKELIKVTVIYFIVSLTIIVIVELWTHTYQQLIKMAVMTSKPDVTFIWLKKYSGILGYVTMFLFSALVSIFAEELFFRGLLLQLFKRKFNSRIAIFLQALLFCLPHIIAGLFMSAIQGVVLVVIYGIVIYGLLGGWAANKTNSIWPGLITANINNLILTIIYF